MNTTVTALRFFFKVTLDRPQTTRRLVFVYEPRQLPRVLSPEEVLRLLEAAPGPKYKAALSLAYGAGLRAMEVVGLKVCDVDSKRTMIRWRGPRPQGPRPREPSQASTRRRHVADVLADRCRRHQ
jgi:integrase/recombinase XerD